MKGSVLFLKDKLSAVVEGSHYSNIAVLTDANTGKACFPLMEGLLPKYNLIEVAAGEEHKNLETCKVIWHRLTELNFDRHSLLIILGGGVLGDMGGFCAATYKRGIDFILMPTTLLSQVDASVGGKLGIDFEDFKNHIGVFCEPKATIIDTVFLSTLPKRELRSGFAEIIKHCLISDRTMWNIIRKKSLDEQDWKSLVVHSVGFKKSVTEKDPVEKGLRKILNFGHTIGHAVESYFLKKGNRIFHGEAIAMGMIMEAMIAASKGLISAVESEEIQNYILKIFPEVLLPFERTEVIQLMLQDKKNREGEILMALPKEIGDATWDVKVTRAELDDAFDSFERIQI
jgi:3-dehydroquinate synthase